MVSQDRELVWLRGTFSPVYDMYNDISKIIFIGSDNTNEKIMEIRSAEQNELLKKQEEALRQSEFNLKEKLRETREAVRQQYKEIEKVKNRNEKALEGTLDAIIMTNQYGIVEFYNKAAANLFGINKEEVLGKNVSMLFTKEQLEKDEFISKYARAGVDKIIGVRKEITIINKKGESVPVLILLTEASLETDYTFTAFIQNISVDLF